MQLSLSELYNELQYLMEGAQARSLLPYEPLERLLPSLSSGVEEREQKLVRKSAEENKVADKFAMLEQCDLRLSALLVLCV